jgi:hypothetical protein
VRGYDQVKQMQSYSAQFSWARKQYLGWRTAIKDVNAMASRANSLASRQQESGTIIHAYIHAGLSSSFT